MADTNEKKNKDGAAPVAEVIERLRPTMFIALGGTGMKVNIRLRRRILNAIWGGNFRVRQISDFPVVQFVNFDLDAGEVTQDDKSVKTDLLAEQVAFTSEEKIIERLDLGKYTRSDDELRRHREVAEWFPLTPERIKALKINPEQGAGQIRAISRLYFFDKYAMIRDRLRDKIERLLSTMGGEADKLKKLGLEIEPGKVRVVITASAAGGTGSGAFLDMGYLAKAILKEKNVDGKVDLFLVLPGGFVSATNPDRLQANGYAALMELETAMRGHKLVKQWDASDNLTIESRPFDDVYIIDNTNVALAKTSDQSDIYEMLSDIFFTDFTSQDFANKKRSIAVNQSQHKIRAYSVRLPQDYGDDTELQFTAGYSSMGQAVLDTQMDARQNVLMNRQVQQMLKAFFGISNGVAGNNRPSVRERDEFMSEQLRITPRTFTEVPEFLSRVELTQISGEFTHYQVADDLLMVEGDSSIGAQIEQKVELLFQQLQTGSGDREQWPEHVRRIQQQLERDTKGNRVDSAERNHEVRTRENRHKRLAEITREDALPDKLFRALDDDERGGLDYTLALVEMIKDRLENEATGIIPALEKNAARFGELSEKLETSELAREFERLRETTGRGLFARIAGKDKQADIVLVHVKDAIRESLLCYVRQVASREAAQLLRDLSDWLGRKTSVDHAGQPLWSGFVGRLQDGRQAVEDVLAEVESEIEKIEASIKEKHSTLIPISPVVSSEAGPGPADMREWAKDAFKDFGGSKTLFSKLQEDTGRDELLFKLRNKATQQIPRAQMYDTLDPLVAALAALSPEEVREKFRQLLQRALPWAPLNLDDFGVTKDRFTCLIGVKDAPYFRRTYSSTMQQVLPQGVGMTASQIQFVESGLPGKLICFTELSGFPAPALIPLSTYQASYRKEVLQIPLHTHKRTSQFVQPIRFSQEQYRQFAEDFKLYLHALGLGVLARRKDEKYEITLHGDSFSIGDEFAVRQHGIDPVQRKDIQEQVRKRLDAVRDPAQFAALAEIFANFANRAYKPQKRANEHGVETFYQTLPYKLADLLRQEYRQKLERQAGDAGEEMLERVRNCADQWSVSVPGSAGDVYEHEVHAEHGEKQQVAKRFFEAGWLESVMGMAAVPASSPVGSGSVPPMPSSGFTPPPVVAVPPGHAYHLSVAGQTYGPFSVGQIQQYVAEGRINRDSVLWRELLSGWTAASAIPELSGLFASATVPPAPFIA